ncbi:unnamed protein product [Linum tenue]|uniref:Uncharacterized protein n=1 Tax=Linum tenue TaxID=586396 RepID=A0AAV0KS66_9ROSI|nr:unnamed protein product [Linum tenue]
MLSRPRQPAAPPPVSLVARPAGNHQQSPPGAIATKSLLLSSKSSLSLSQDRQSKSDELGYLRLEYQGCMAFSPSCHCERESSTGKTTWSSQGYGPAGYALFVAVYAALEEKQKSKVKEKLDKCVKEKLIDFCDVLNIQVTKATVIKVELTVRIKDFLESPHATTDVLLADKEQRGKKRRSITGKNSSPGEASAKENAEKVENLIREVYEGVTVMFRKTDRRFDDLAKDLLDLTGRSYEHCKLLRETTEVVEAEVTELRGYPE